MLSKASVRYQLFVFRSIFFQMSSCQVRSPREIYPQVHKEIVKPNLHDFLFYINVIISYSFNEFAQSNTANMLCRLFDDRKYMDIFLPILQEYCYFGKQKNSLYFSASTCEHLWPSPSNLVNCAKCLHNPSKDTPIGQLSPILEVY